MPEHTIPLAQERMSGQPHKQLSLISTPRFPGIGINAEFLDSTMEHFFFPCPKCGKKIELKHENLKITADNIHDPKIKESYVVCLECSGTLFDGSGTEEEYADLKSDMQIKAEWVATGHKDFDVRGFYINQLYSPTIRPYHLAIAYLKSLTNKSAEQEYHNSKMGDAHEVEGARITSDVIDKCLSSHGRRQSGRGDYVLVTMGVDVGRWLHYEICAWVVKRYGNDINIMSDCVVLEAGKKAHFGELDLLMRAYQVKMAVIDIQPETRQALDFAKRFPGYVRLCRYAKNITNKMADPKDGDEYIISVDRTSWLDLSLGRFHNRSIDLPVDLSLEYRSHVKNIARIYEEDKDGNQIGRYISNGDDHFAHARNYCEIALPLAVASETGTPIRGLL